MKNKLFTLTVFCFALTANTSGANNDVELQKQVYDRASGEFATCSAYYSVFSAAMNLSGKQKASDEADEAMEKAFNVALELARQAGSEEEANRMTWSRFQSALDAMEKEAGKDYGNISTVRSKYSKRCEWIMTSPEEFMKEKYSESKNKVNVKK